MSRIYLHYFKNEYIRMTDTSIKLLWKYIPELEKYLPLNTALDIYHTRLNQRMRKVLIFELGEEISDKLHEILKIKIHKNISKDLYCISRHDLVLIEEVEKLGMNESAGDDSFIKIISIPYDLNYSIEKVFDPLYEVLKVYSNYL
jgi:hypothetical protein